MMPDFFSNSRAKLHANSLSNSLTNGQAKTEVNTFVYLEKFLSKADLTVLSAPLTAIQWLVKIAELTEFDSQALAALHLKSIGQPSDSWVCYVSPVLMQPNRDHLAIVQSRDFQFEAAELNALCTEFNDYFEEEGYRFQFLTPQIWICYGEHALTVAKQSPHAIVGDNIVAHLPSRDTDVRWQKLFNEVQMLLHHSASNKARILDGKPEINSLWFWGGGCLPADFQLPFSQVMTNNAEINGLSQLGGITPRDLSDDIGEDIVGSLIYVDVLAESNADLLIERYMESIFQLLKNKTLDEVIIIPDFTQQFTLTRRGLMKFWKSRRSISSFISSPEN